MRNWPAIAHTCLTGLIEAERMCGVQRDRWFAVMHVSTDEARLIVAQEAERWDAVAAYIRAIIGGLDDE